MKFSVVITNYNGAAYLQEAVESVLAQTLPAYEIIVVDDGSTDDSMALLQRYYGSNALVKVVPQRNQGQIAAVATGLDHATGEILCVLDPDDRYKPHYLQELEVHYRLRSHVDLTFCRFEAIGTGPFRTNEELIWLSPATDYDYGLTALISYFGKVAWLGNVTSTLSLRMRMARRLELRDVADTINCLTSADFTLLVGTSLLGGRKFHLHQELVDYRHHDGSTNRRRQRDKALLYPHHYTAQVRANYYRARSLISPDMSTLLPNEALTIPQPMPEHLKFYARISTVLKHQAAYLARKSGGK